VARRPNDPKECLSAADADRFRRQVTKEIATKITLIQNPGLGEFKIRDINDDINKKLRLKYKWEDRIIELGGPDYHKFAPKMLDRTGREIPGMHGYKYFGAAKDLPGVRELFEPEPIDTGKKTRAELMKNIDADYYGYLDDDDGLLMPLEAEQEEKLIRKAVAEWKANKNNQSEAEQMLRRHQRDNDPDRNIYIMDDESDDEPDVVAPAAGQIDQTGGEVRLDFRSEPVHIDQPTVPTQVEVEEAIIRRKKMELLQKYASDTLVEQSHQASILLGIEPASSSARV